MKNIAFWFVSILIFSQQISAQNKAELEPCGSPSFRSEWLKKYQKNPSEFAHRGGQIYLPIAVHNVSQDDGSGTFAENSVLRSLCTLSEDFSETEITLFLKHFVSINDSELFQHSSYPDAAYKMWEYNFEDAMNSYIVGNPNGNCGYNLPYAGVALSQACAQPGDHTWAHEIGHALDIPHPFLGWEGGESYDGSGNLDFGNPAPEFVLYDYTLFKDSLILDTIIIDTAFVEKLDGSNCEYAADGFCDTAPDYLAQRWPCDSDNTSFIEQTDPNGAKFNSDASLFMSYGFDACASRFSLDQAAAMAANATTEKGHLVEETDPSGPLASAADMALGTPLDQGLDFKDVTFSWETIENADYYLVEVGVPASLSIAIFDTIVSSTEILVPELSNNFDYYWKVTPFSATQFCNLESSAIEEVVFSDVSSNIDINESQLKLIPNLLSEGQDLKIETDLKINSFEIINSAGQLISSGTYTSSLKLPSGIGTGVYYVRFTVGTEIVLKKFVKI